MCCVHKNADLYLAIIHDSNAPLMHDVATCFSKLHACMGFNAHMYHKHELVQSGRSPILFCNIDMYGCMSKLVYPASL